MIACISCRSLNLYGAVFCAECGSLLPLNGNPTPMQPQGTPSERPSSSADRAPSTSSGGGLWATLRLLEGGEDIALANREEFTLGRRSEHQPTLPDIDLAPYQGYARGVSRVHAVIRRRGTRVLLKDLNSSNGTYVNGRRLNPSREEPLANGDILALGTLKLQIQLSTP